MPGDEGRELALVVDVAVALEDRGVLGVVPFGVGRGRARGGSVPVGPVLAEMKRDEDVVGGELGAGVVVGAFVGPGVGSAVGSPVGDAVGKNAPGSSGSVAAAAATYNHRIKRIAAAISQLNFLTTE